MKIEITISDINTSSSHDRLDWYYVKKKDL